MSATTTTRARVPSSRSFPQMNFFRHGEARFPEMKIFSTWRNARTQTVTICLAVERVSCGQAREAGPESAPSTPIPMMPTKTIPNTNDRRRMTLPKLSGLKLQRSIKDILFPRSRWKLPGPIVGHAQCALKWTFGAAGACGHHASSIAATTRAAAARSRLSGLW